VQDRIALENIVFDGHRWADSLIPLGRIGNIPGADGRW
jgi:hypothetical protein